MFILEVIGLVVVMIIYLGIGTAVLAALNDKREIARKEGRTRLPFGLGWRMLAFFGWPLLLLVGFLLHLKEALLHGRVPK